MEHEATNSKNPKKRKLSRISKTNAAYQNLLNTTIHEISHSTPEDPKPLPATQINLTKWTSQEKTLFFHALERLGKHDIRGIAERIGEGKSALQVREYILLLEQGVEELKSGIDMAEIPAAIEISRECCEVLEEVAGMVEAEQRGREERMERGVWGGEWLVDWELAGRLEEIGAIKSQLQVQDEEQNERSGKVDSLVKAAELLKPATFISLCTHFFMNTSDPLSNNWQSIISQNGTSTPTNKDEDEEFPSIRATAFTDFYNLTTQLTRRIISTTLFCTESRLRTTRIAGGRTRTRVVKQNDVKAALGMLGLPTSGIAEGWWEGVMRRCGVVVLGEDSKDQNHEGINGNGEEFDSLMDYKKDSEEDGIDRSDVEEDDEEEEEEEGSVHDDRDEDEILPTVKSRGRQREGADQEQKEPPDTNFNSEVEDPYSSSFSTSSSPTQKQATHISALDTHASNLEESHLWTLLDLDPPAHLNISNESKAPKKTQSSRNMIKRDSDGNWSLRGKMEFWSQWEVMNGVVGEEEFLEVERRNKVWRGREGNEGRDGSCLGRRKGISDERVGESDLEDNEESEREDQGELEDEEEGEEESMMEEGDDIGEREVMRLRDTAKHETDRTRLKKDDD